MAHRPHRDFSMLTLLIAACLLPWAASRVCAAPDEPRAALAGRHTADASAHLLGRVEAARPVTLALVLPLRDQAGLTDLLSRQYDPADPLFHHFLSVTQFTDRFGPAMSDVTAVAQYAKAQGLTVTDIAANHVIVTITGPAAAAETALGVRFNDYQAPDGTRFRAPDREPTLPRNIAARLLDVAGTDDLPRAHPFLHHVRPSLDTILAETGIAQPHVIGSGHYGALSPGDVRQIYGLNSISYTGTGQTLGLFELDGYTASDITQFEGYYGIPAVTLQNVLIDGFNGVPSSAGASEVTLDIDMMLATGPGISKIIVYEADNSTAGTIAAYNQMASDNTAGILSTSWGSDEGTVQSAGTELSMENNAFMEMAAQGQSNFAAAGDYGAYDNTSTLSVDDPGSQPYMCDVGGTDVTVTRSITYSTESAWGDAQDTMENNPRGAGGGGGISAVWSLPSYQNGITTSAPISTTMRNVPDVALYGDFDTGGYDVYYTDPATPNSGGWTGYNGTSASAPLWAGYMARVNQARAAAGLGRIGLPNTLIYAIGKNAAKYTADFHDINDGTTNLYYAATTGYDLATGWGSPKTATLLADLSPSSSSGGSGTWSAADVASAADGTARILWKRSDGAAGLWTLNANNARTVTGATYGPFSDSGGSWTALAVGVAPDGTSRILWRRSDGAIGVWAMNANDTQTSVGPVYGPYSGWTAEDLAVSVSGSRILWRRSDGAAGVWTMNAAGTQTSVGPSYGPYPNWTATGVSAATDGTARILWTRSDGAAGLWTLSANNSQTVVGPIYGPYSGWTAVDVGTSDTGSSTVLWRNASGAAGLWTFSASDMETTMGSVYGPYSGYTAAQSDLSSTGTTRILWLRSDRAAGLWSFNSADTATVAGAVYGPF